MSDIVERLRAPLGVMQCEVGMGPAPENKLERRWLVALEAADEIERLRAEVETWADKTRTAVWADSEECKFLTAENERLRAENFSLAAWQCEFTDGKTGLVASEGGSTFCAMAKRVEKLRAALREIASHTTNPEGSGPAYGMVGALVRIARAALEEK